MNPVLTAIQRHCFRCPHPRACAPCVYREYRKAHLIETRNAWLLLQCFGERLDDVTGQAKEEEATA